MPDPNSVLVNIGAATQTIIAAPGPTTTVWPPPPYPLAFIRVLGLNLTGTSTSVLTITSKGSGLSGGFPDRVLDIIQVGAGGGLALAATSPGAGGMYDCDPGSSLQITNSAGTVTGSIRYAITGAP